MPLAPASSIVGPAATAATAAPVRIAATTPGLTYSTYNFLSFRPVSDADGYVAGPLGAHCTRPTPNTMYCDLELPTGARVTEVQFTGHNGSGAPKLIEVLGFAIGRFDELLVASMHLPPTDAGLGTLVSTEPFVVDPAFFYQFLVQDTSPDVTAFSLRIGYEGPFGFFPLSQVRALDTRDPGPLTGPLRVGETRRLPLGPAVPAGAAAAVVNVTVTNTVNRGYLTLCPGGATRPPTSSINWFASGQSLANNATVAVAADGTIDLFCGGSGAPATDVVVDLLGYYA